MDNRYRESIDTSRTGNQLIMAETLAQGRRACSVAGSRAIRRGRNVYVATDGRMYVTDCNAGLHVLQYEG